MNEPKFLIPTEKATKRTLVRLREFGPMFYLGREMPDILLNGEVVKARLLSAKKSHWVGWVPSDHIRIVRPPRV